MTKEDVLKLAVDYYKKAIWEYPEVLNYLLQRGISEESINRFQIGYCDDTFYDYAEQEKIVNLGIQAGILTQYREWFKGYITFPVYLETALKNIYGRTFEENSFTHTLLKGSKKEFVFNYSALSKESLYITESPLDCITLVQNGFNAIAVFGCKVPSAIAHLFKGKTCYILFDNDDAGKHGALVSAYNLFDFAKKIQIVNFPDSLGKTDVNSFFCSCKKSSDRLLFLTKNSTQYKKKHRLPEQSNFDDDHISVIEVGKLIFPDFIDKGNSIWVRCPQHGNGNETKRSLWIGGNKNMFTCFGCNVSGGAVKLVMKYLKLNKEEAQSWLESHGF